MSLVSLLSKEREQRVGSWVREGEKEERREEGTERKRKGRETEGRRKAEMGKWQGQRKRRR